MELYQIYLILSVVLIISEIYVPGFVMLPIGVAGLLTAAVAYFRPEYWLHAIFFICGSGLALIALAKFRDQPSLAIDQEAPGILGKIGTVVALPTSHSALKIKVYGDTWDTLEDSIPAEALSEFTLGTQVRVVKVIGNRIAVEKI